MIKAGADVNARDKSITTPLHWAAWAGKTETALVLIKAGADVNAKNKNINTPLHWAAWSGETETALALIKAGADVSIRNYKDETFIQIARRVNQNQFAQYFEREIPNIQAAMRKEKEDTLRSQQEAQEQRLRQQDDSAFASAAKAGTVNALSSYLSTSPYETHQAEASKALASLLVKSGDLARIMGMAKKYPGLVDHLPLKYSLALIGPPGLTVAEVLDIRKKGVSDRIIAAQIRSTGAAYKKFSLKEIMALNKMGLSDEVVEAMIDSTTEARKTQAQADYMRKLESLNAQQRAELEQIKLKMDQMQEAQQAQASTASASSVRRGGGGASGGGGQSNCVAQATAVELCRQTTSGLLRMACMATAKTKFPCN